MKKLNLLFIAIILVIASCKKQESESVQDKTAKEEQVEEKTITLSKLKNSVNFPEAKISLEKPEISPIDSETGKAQISYNFNVQDYELGKQTPGAGENGLANSGKGQHIHYILNNAPYSAHYEASFTKEAEAGHHVLLAFLSRSYHESVKNAFLVKPITIGDPKGEAPNLSAQHLFYSRPKGTYSGKDTENLLLDFFLVNTEISETGNHVKATIDGEDFIITEWAPYVIKGLDKGVIEIRLQLLNAEGNLIPGPFNDVTRKVTLE